MSEISALSVELSKEEQRRSENDKFLLEQVNSFFDGLKCGADEEEDVNLSAEENERKTDQNN